MQRPNRHHTRTMTGKLEWLAGLTPLVAVVAVIVLSATGNSSHIPAVIGMGTAAAAAWAPSTATGPGRTVAGDDTCVCRAVTAMTRCTSGQRPASPRRALASVEDVPDGRSGHRPGTPCRLHL